MPVCLCRRMVEEVGHVRWKARGGEERQEGRQQARKQGKPKNRVDEGRSDQLSSEQPLPLPTSLVLRPFAQVLHCTHRQADTETSVLSMNRPFRIRRDDKILLRPNEADINCDVDDHVPPTRHTPSTHTHTGHAGVAGPSVERGHVFAGLVLRHSLTHFFFQTPRPPSKYTPHSAPHTTALPWPPATRHDQSKQASSNHDDRGGGGGPAGHGH